MKQVLIFILIISHLGELQGQDTTVRVQNDLGYQIVESSGKYLICDSLGEVAVIDTFDSASLESISSWEKKRNTFICKKGEEAYLVSPNAQKVIRFDSILNIEGGSYIGTYNNEYTLIDDEFNLLHNDLDFLHPLYRMDGEFIFAKNDVWGILDSEDVLIKINVDSMIDIFSWKYIGIAKSEKMGLFDYEKEEVLFDPSYDYVIESHFHKEGEKERFLIFNDGQFKIINRKGKELTKNDFESITTWVEYGPAGHYIMRDGKIGIIDYDGKEIIPIQYDELFYCYSGIYKAVVDGKFGVISRKRRVIVPFIFDSIIVDDFRVGPSEEPFIYALSENIWKKIDYSGTVVLNNANDSEFIKTLMPYQTDHYGFDYVRSLMISSEKVPKL